MIGAAPGSRRRRAEPERSCRCSRRSTNPPAHPETCRPSRGRDDKSRRPPGHVCGDDRRGCAKPHSPPRLAVTGDISPVCAHFFRAFQESVDGAALGVVQLVEVDGKVDHATKFACVVKKAVRLKQLACAGNGSEKNGTGQARAVFARNPYLVASRDLAPVNPAQFAKLDVSIWRLVGCAGEVGPTRLSGKAVAVNPAALVERVEVAQAVDSSEENGSWFGGNFKGGDGGCRRGVGEGLRGRFDNRDALAPEFLQEKGPDQSAVIHVKPFGGGDKRTEVAGPGVAGGRQEEMNVQPGQLACLVAKFRGFVEKPVFPFLGDLVMTHVRWVADVERRR